MHLGGIILCGGQSSRMGQSKAWLPLGQHRMLPWIVEQVRSAASPIVVVAGPDQDLPQLPESIRLVRDREPGQGPLRGIEAGLTALEGACDAAYVSSCDVPFLKPAFITRLAELLGDHEIAVPFFEGRYHPLSSVMRLCALATVRAQIEANRRKLTLLVEACRTRIVSPKDFADVDPHLHSLRNVNTPEEYEQALRDWQ